MSREVIIYGNELYHHGIKGQKWGIRRFQNEDGTLTEEGKRRYGVTDTGTGGNKKSRYGRGREISKAEQEFYNRELRKQKESNKESNEAKKESERLAKRYGLDADDGGGGDTERFSSETLRRAGDRYWAKQEDMAALEEKMSERSKKRATQLITKKYGKTAISDMQYYNNVNTFAFFGTVGAVLIGSHLYKKFKK